MRNKAEGRTRRTSISRSTLDMRTEVSILPRLMSLTATSSPHWMCSPSLTLPNSPSPRVRRSRYGPNFGIVRRGWAAAYSSAAGWEYTSRYSGCSSCWCPVTTEWEARFLLDAAEAGDVAMGCTDAGRVVREGPGEGSGTCRLDEKESIVVRVGNYTGCLVTTASCGWRSVGRTYTSWSAKDAETAPRWPPR